jgi:hypothetical protein
MAAMRMSLRDLRWDDGRLTCTLREMLDRKLRTCSTDTVAVMLRRVIKSVNGIEFIASPIGPGWQVATYTSTGFNEN